MNYFASMLLTDVEPMSCVIKKPRSLDVRMDKSACIKAANTKRSNEYYRRVFKTYGVLSTMQFNKVSGRHGNHGVRILNNLLAKGLVEIVGIDQSIANKPVKIWRWIKGA